MNSPLPGPAYPYNLISRVIGKTVSESELPTDIETSIRYAYSLLSEENGGRVLTLIFKECRSQQEIADKMHFTCTRVNAIFRTSMKELSMGNRPMLFTHGYSYCCENRILGPWLVSMGKKIEPEVFYDLPVYDMGVDVRNKNNLNRGGIYTVGELVQMTEEELLSIRGMGSKGLVMIKARLAEMGLSLA